MKVIITMAGKGSRFIKAGFLMPKYQIIVNGKSLFEWSMLSLIELWEEEFIFIIRGEENKKNIENLIRKTRIKKYSIIKVLKQTDGQASTAFIANDLIGREDSVLIFNIDTYVKEHIIKKSDFEIFDGVIHTFKGKGEKWSFAKVDGNNKVLEITEKIRISENASIGLYYFKKWSFFVEVYKDFKSDIKEIYKEVYIAPLYSYLISKYDIRICRINSNDVHILGTPEDVEVFKKNIRYIGGKNE